MAGSRVPPAIHSTRIATLRRQPLLVGQRATLEEWEEEGAAYRACAETRELYVPSVT